MSTPIEDAVKTLIDAMKADPNYAWVWHCIVKMAVYDEGGDLKMAHGVATRFMRMTFDVDTSEAPEREAA